MSYNQQNPVLLAGGSNPYQNYNQQQYVNPTTRLTVEQMNHLNQSYMNQQQTFNDPYTSGMNLLAQCSDLVKTKIMQDQRYVQIDNECEILIKQYIYSNVIPQILTSQQGRLSFERWENCIKELKEEYSREEISMTQNMQALMNDPIVLARLQELQQNAEKMNVPQDANIQDTTVNQSQQSQRISKYVRKTATQLQQDLEQNGDVG